MRPALASSQRYFEEPKQWPTLASRRGTKSPSTFCTGFMGCSLLQIWRHSRLGSRQILGHWKSFARSLWSRLSHWIMKSTSSTLIIWTWMHIILSKFVISWWSRKLCKESVDLLQCRLIQDTFSAIMSSIDHRQPRQPSSDEITRLYFCFPTRLARSRCRIFLSFWSITSMARPHLWQWLF